MFTGKEEHKVSFKKAQALIKAYQKNKAKKEVKALYYGKDAISKILRQRGCIGLRIYYAKKTTGANTLVITGVDKKGNDIVKGPLAEFGFPCPPYCPPDKSIIIEPPEF
ncbi:MAG: hypothetical protein KJ620_09955 [Candidatus Edwardsbacteria bacterium]|nr:hypothetical protein [Candidatus Edwardsbacteria bacterium]MBU1577648.1 hypothetical protein [Candidatus Edwardsbacteria bacterium]MBU2592954.1 hypothetical protein [Candidatus Edwardsbacteria bacterium]